MSDLPQKLLIGLRLPGSRGLLVKPLIQLGATSWKDPCLLPWALSLHSHISFFPRLPLPSSPSLVLPEIRVGCILSVWSQLQLRLPTDP